MGLFLDFQFSSIDQCVCFLAGMCRLSLVAVSRGCSVFAGHWLLIVVAALLWSMGSVIAAHGLQSMGSIVVVHGFSCPVSCGIFLDQGSYQCPLHYEADS